MRVLATILASLGLLASVSSDAVSAPSEQAVIVQFDYGSHDWSAFFQFEPVLDTAVTNSGAGDYDGNELATDGSDGYLYFYGPDADKLFAVVKAQLAKAPFMKNIRVTLRYGAAKDSHAREVHIKLAS